MFHSKYHIRLAALALAFLMTVLGPAVTLNVHAAPGEDPLEGRANGFVLPGFFDEERIVTPTKPKMRMTTSEESMQPMDNTDGTENDVSYDDRYAGLLGDGLVHQRRFANTTIRYGVDVSAHQEEIDWAKVKAAGAEFAFLRVGYRGWGTGKMVLDPYFKQNIEGAQKQGILVGVYFFSQAISVEEAIEEADFAMAPLKGYSLDLPVVYDVEYASQDGEPVGRLYEANLDEETRTAVTLAFLERVEAAGYRGCLYGSRSALEDEIKCDMSKIEGTYPIWLANYTNETRYEGDFCIWQHSPYAKVDGISWQVDVNVWYDDGSLDPDPGVWEQTEGYWYYLNRKTGVPLTGWQMSKGYWFYLDEDDGRMITGWLFRDGRWYYLKPNGVMATGWLNIAGSWYYLADSGRMCTGWQKVGGSWYYLAENGKMRTGWQKVGGSWYYFLESGRMATGWVSLYGSWYYLASSGEMVTGWRTIGNAAYYFHPGGKMATGWLEDGNRWYYLRGSGRMAVGWQKVGGNWYFFSSDGEMVTGWQTIGSTKYYFRDSGRMTTGWLKLDGTWYHFESDGSMSTGWLHLDGKTYYCNSRGELLRGRYRIGGKWYTFDKVTGELK